MVRKYFFFKFLNLIKEKCSFAHGKNELKEKKHLNINYKTRPCKQYFLKGYCPYGYRCQYLHSETIFVEEFRPFLISAYKENGLNYKNLEKFETEQIRVQKMEKNYEISGNLTDYLSIRRDNRRFIFNY